MGVAIPETASDPEADAGPEADAVSGADAVPEAVGLTVNAKVVGIRAVEVVSEPALKNTSIDGTIVENETVVGVEGTFSTTKAA